MIANVEALFFIDNVYEDHNLPEEILFMPTNTNIRYYSKNNKFRKSIFKL